MTRAHVAARGWVAAELEKTAAKDVSAAHAAALVDIAEENEVPIDHLVFWINTNRPGKEWALEEWRSWCATYKRAMQQLHEQNTGQWKKLCPNCLTSVAHRVAENWHCNNCGVIQ